MASVPGGGRWQKCEDCWTRRVASPDPNCLLMFVREAKRCLSRFASTSYGLILSHTGQPRSVWLTLMHWDDRRPWTRRPRIPFDMIPQAQESLLDEALIYPDQEFRESQTSSVSVSSIHGCEGH